LGNEVQDSNNKYDSKFIVNAAGAQADRISREIDVGLDYAMLPFMGVYRYTRQDQLSLKRLVYPVPHPLNPFLGVHFTLTVDGLVKIGPTAIPIVGREQYSIREGWSIVDSVQAVKSAVALVKGESHNLGSILKSEWPKIMLSKLVQESAELVPSAIGVKNWKKKPPGIRAQLVHLPSGKLEQDFVVRRHLNSFHVLNAVSPGWTSAIPFGKWLVEKYLSKSTTAND
jgi:L-2-hydroxyglutarate oxidase LhgO